MYALSKLIIGKSQVGVIANTWQGRAYMPPPSLPPASPNRVKDGPHTDRMHLHLTCHFVCSSHHMKSWLMSFSRKATNVDGLQRAQEKALPAGSTTLHTAHRPPLHESTGAFAPPVFQFQTGLRERKKMKPSWSNLTTERHNKCLDRICLWCKMVRILRLFSAVIKVFFFVQVGSNWTPHPC